MKHTFASFSFFFQTKENIYAVKMPKAASNLEKTDVFPHIYQLHPHKEAVKVKQQLKHKLSLFSSVKYILLMKPGHSSWHFRFSLSIYLSMFHYNLCLPL